MGFINAVWKNRNRFMKLGLRLTGLFIFSIVLGILSFPASAQRLIVTTAGKDWLPSVEGVQALNLPFSAQLHHFTLDKQGNLYIVDPLGYRVYRIGSDNVVHV